MIQKIHLSLMCACKLSNWRYNKGTPMMLLLFSWCYYTDTTRYCDNCYCCLPCISYMQWKVQYVFKYEPMHVCSVCIHSYSGTWCTAQVLYSGGGRWQLDGVFSVLGAVWPSSARHSVVVHHVCGEVLHCSRHLPQTARKEVKEFCDRDGKENVLPATVSRNTESSERKWPRVWKICVSSLVHAWIKVHVRKLTLLRMYYVSGCVDTSLTQDLFRSL